MRDAVNTRFLFDDYEVDPTRRVLRKGGEVVALNPKTFDLLLALVAKHGETLSKNELLDTVWQDQFVEEKNLTVHVAALRKIFGETKNANRFIATVPGTGYKFVAPLATDQLVIETESVHRITVEEVGDMPLARELPAPRSWSLPKILLVSVPVLLIAVLLAGSFFQKSSSADNTVRSVRRLTTNGKVQIAALSPDGKLFAYVKKDRGRSSLHTGFTAGGTEIELRQPNDSAYEQIAFSPDSTQLYYSMSDERNPRASLFRIPALGGVAEKISDTAIFSLSPDGKQIVFRRVNPDDSVSMVIASPTGSDERELFSFPPLEGFIDGSVSWSPDGSRIAFSCPRKMFYHDLCIADTAGVIVERLTFADYRSIQKTAWLKKGDGIIITAIPENNNSSVVNFQILHVELPGGRITAVTNDLNTYNSSLSIAENSNSLLTVEHRQLNNIWVAPSDNFALAKQITFGSFGKYDGLWGLDWTPDGRIIYNSSNTETQIISMMNADGSGQKDLTSPGSMDSALTVSNDGRYVVFQSVRGGSPDIWRMEIDSGALTQLTFDKKSFAPSISPNDLYVYYKTFANGIGGLQRVPLAGGEPEILTDKETGWPTFSPDGKLFAATLRTDKRRIALFSAATNQLVRQFDIPKTAIIDMRPRWTPDNLAIVYRDGNSGYWSQPITGGEPTKLEGFPDEELFANAFSKDGKQFAFVRGQTIRDVILFEKFK